MADPFLVLKNALSVGGQQKVGLSPKVSYRVQSKHETVMFESASNNRAASDRMVMVREEVQSGMDGFESF